MKMTELKLQPFVLYDCFPQLTAKLGALHNMIILCLVEVSTQQRDDFIVPPGLAT